MDPGTVIAGRYVIDRLAGFGGMASVYKARDEEESRWVALKVLRPQVAHLEQRFVRESKMLRELRHPAIVRYYDSGVTLAHQRFLVMEWLDGIDLAARLQNEPLSVAEALAVMGRIGAALAFAHEHHIVHRDIKPSNIFLSNGEVDTAKLLDFGVAGRSTHATRSGSGSGTRFGTPAYMSPEQVRGGRHLNPRTDVFSLGCVLFECLTGEPAFAAHDMMAVFCKILMDRPPAVRELAPQVPAAIDALVRRMLSKRPTGRPRSSDVVCEIRDISASLPPPQLDHKPLAQPGRTAITQSEQRVVHVVVAAASANLLESGGVQVLNQQQFETETMGPPTDSAESDELISKLADSAFGELPEHLRQFKNKTRDPLVTTTQLERITIKMALLGARFNVMGDGSVIALLDSRDTGGPVARAVVVDQAASAARCALVLREEVPGAIVALAGGRAVIEKRRLIGDVIDRAFQLLRAAEQVHTTSAHQGGTIRIDQLTAALLGPRFYVDGDATRGFCLLSEQRSLSGETVSPVAIPFIGRARDLRKLARVLDECIEDEVAQTVLVTGPPGFGKSRLCREFLAQLEQDEHEVDIWLAQADPLRARAPLHVIADAVRYVTGIHESRPPAVCRYELRERIDQYFDVDRAIRASSAESAERVTAFLGELINLAPPLARIEEPLQLSAARRDPKLMGDQIRRAFIDLIGAATRRRPLLLVIDDLQWADRATVSLLDRALRHLAERPLMILALSRPEIRDSFPGLWSEHGVTEFRLGRLPRRAAEEAIRTVLGQDIASERVVALVEHADGNAFYLEELVRNAAAGESSLPETVVAMAQSRLVELDPQARQILRAASVFGDVFWLSGVVDLVGEDIDVEEWLHNLVASEFIVRASASRFSGEPQYSFRHALIREAVYEMLPDEERQLGHCLAAAWLDKAGETEGGVIADHFERGGTPDRALPFYVRAAEDALNRSDFDAAHAVASRGVACGAAGTDLGRLLRIQVHEQIWRGSLTEIVRLGNQAMALVPRGSRIWYELAGEVGMALGKLGQVSQIKALARHLLRGVEEQGDCLGWCVAGATLAQQLYVSGHSDAADSLLIRVEEEIGDLDGADPWAAAAVHFARAVRADTIINDPAAVLQEVKKCVACYESIGDARQACLHRGNAGYAMAELGLYEQAEVELRYAAQIADELKLENAAQGVRRQLALVLAHRGANREAQDIGRRAREWFTGQDTRANALARLDLADILMLGGDLHNTEREARSALALLGSSAPLRPRALVSLARVYLRLGNTEQALAAATEAMELLDTLESVEASNVVVRLVHAEALHAAGKQKDAYRAIAAAREYLLISADRISQGEWRKSYLENIPDHARTMHLAQRWAAAGFPAH
ncbi:MAG: protein kinase [Proteobacteria bacterium]|nr:protein kinase [Pseudomonadota bacterium]